VQPSNRNELAAGERYLSIGQSGGGIRHSKNINKRNLKRPNVKKRLRRIEALSVTEAWQCFQLDDDGEAAASELLTT